ncbi:MAG: hypothetical protein ACJ8LI_10445, partial [Chthoniobacterales bacterium]
LGIGLGWWWSDAVAAGVISVEILKDGVHNLQNSVAQLMNKRPTSVDEKEKDPVLDKVKDAVKRLDWVRDVRVRLREDSDVLSGEIFVVPRDEANLIARVEEATCVATEVDWRLFDINVVPVREIDGSANPKRTDGAIR